MNAIVAGIGVGVILSFLSWVLSRMRYSWRRFVIYPGIAGVAGGGILLLVSLFAVGDWEGIGLAFFAVPIIVISGIMLLLITSYRRLT